MQKFQRVACNNCACNHGFSSVTVTLALFAGRRESVAGLTETLEAAVDVDTLTVETDVVHSTLILICTSQSSRPAASASSLSSSLSLAATLRGSRPGVQSASLHDNFCKTGNYVIYDVIIWVQDGNCKKMARENFSIGAFYNI